MKSVSIADPATDGDSDQCIAQKRIADLERTVTSLRQQLKEADELKQKLIRDVDLNFREWKHENVTLAVSSNFEKIFETIILLTGVGTDPQRGAVVCKWLLGILTQEVVFGQGTCDRCNEVEAHIIRDVGCLRARNFYLAVTEEHYKNPFRAEMSNVPKEQYWCNLLSLRLMHFSLSTDLSPEISKCGFHTWGQEAKDWEKRKKEYSRLYRMTYELATSATLNALAYVLTYPAELQFDAAWMQEVDEDRFRRDGVEHEGWVVAQCLRPALTIVALSDMPEEGLLTTRTMEGRGFRSAPLDDHGISKKAPMVTVKALVTLRRPRQQHEDEASTRVMPAMASSSRSVPSTSHATSEDSRGRFVLRVNKNGLRPMVQESPPNAPTGTSHRDLTAAAPDQKPAQSRKRNRPLVEYDESEVEMVEKPENRKPQKKRSKKFRPSDEQDSDYAPEVQRVSSEPARRPLNNAGHDQILQKTRPATDHAKKAVRNGPVSNDQARYNESRKIFPEEAGAVNVEAISLLLKTNHVANESLRISESVFTSTTKDEKATTLPRELRSATCFTTLRSQMKQWRVGQSLVGFGCEIDVQEPNGDLQALTSRLWGFVVQPRASASSVPKVILRNFVTADWAKSCGVSFRQKKFVKTIATKLGSSYDVWIRHKASKNTASPVHLQAESWLLQMKRTNDRVLDFKDAELLKSDYSRVIANGVEVKDNNEAQPVDNTADDSESRAPDDHGASVENDIQNDINTEDQKPGNGSDEECESVDQVGHREEQQKFQDTVDALAEADRLDDAGAAADIEWSLHEGRLFHAHREP